MLAVPKIGVRNLQHKIQIDVVDLENFARRAVKLCLRLARNHPSELAQLAEVMVLIVSDRKIATIHKQFMNKTGPTDVITFHHGEIFISAEMARRNALRFGSSLSNELHLYIVHGLLHLHGFDDRSEANARKMEMTQRRILTKAML
jgi:probable rRNA maturation factor